ncbi:MAG: hypothetical protein ACLP4R_25825 [Solirubrobacteraceae bacterium]
MVSERRPRDGTVTDAKTGEAFDLPVREGERALEVFHHPYAYAALRQQRRVPITASHSS